MVLIEPIVNKKSLIRATETDYYAGAKVRLAQDYLNAGNLPQAISLLQEAITSLNSSPQSTARIHCSINSRQCLSPTKGV